MKFKSVIKKYREKEEGFTLVEILVVIAIMGILSSIILVNLNSARGKAADVKIKSEVANIKTQLEMGYSVGYVDLTAAASNIDDFNNAGPGYDSLVLLKDNILAQIGPSAAFQNINGLIIYSNAVSGTPSDYGIYASTTEGYVCIDSFGNTNSAGVGIIPDWATISAGTPNSRLCL